MTAADHWKWLPVGLLCPLLNPNCCYCLMSSLLGCQSKKRQTPDHWNKLISSGVTDMNQILYAKWICQLPGWGRTVWDQWVHQTHWRWQTLAFESCSQLLLRKIVFLNLPLFTFLGRSTPWSLIKVRGGGILSRSTFRPWESRDKNWPVRQTLQCGVMHHRDVKKPPCILVALFKKVRVTGKPFFNMKDGETWGSSRAAKFFPTDGAGAVKFKPGNDAPRMEAVLALQLLHRLPIGEVLRIWGWNYVSATFYFCSLPPEPQNESILPPSRQNRMYSSRALHLIFPPTNTDVVLQETRAG